MQLQRFVSVEEFCCRLSYSPLPVQNSLSKVNVKRVPITFFNAKFILLALPLFSMEVFSQELPRIPQFNNDEVNITLDGFVDESIWENIPIVDDMKISDPDTLKTRHTKLIYGSFIRLIYFSWLTSLRIA